MLLIVDFLICKALLPSALFPYPYALPTFAQVLILLAVAMAFFRRGDSFYDRAMSTPFAVAVAEMSFNAEAKQTKKIDE